MGSQSTTPKEVDSHRSEAVLNAVSVIIAIMVTCQS